MAPPQVRALQAAAAEGQRHEAAAAARVAALTEGASEQEARLRGEAERAARAAAATEGEKQRLEGEAAEAKARR